ncbi:hypothetical protein ACJJTC_011512 [Scirpophaga incertulas]
MSDIEQLRAELEQLRTQNNNLTQQQAELQRQITQTEPNAVNTNQIFGIRPNLAPFWLDRPAAWFAHVEAQFALTGITSDETKYNYIISQIDSRLSRELEDLVVNPPARGQRYDWIKLEMVRRFSTSDSQRIRQLISGEELGDRKPSQFLRHLRSLAGNLSDDHILRELFMQRLPRSAQQILAAHADMKLEKVAELADSILEVNSSSVNSIQSSPQIAELTAQVLELTRQVAALSSSHQKSGFRSRSTLRSRSKSRSRKISALRDFPLPKTAQVLNMN